MSCVRFRLGGGSWNEKMWNSYVRKHTYETGGETTEMTCCSGETDTNSIHNSSPALESFKKSFGESVFTTFWGMFQAI